jgi:hypothetical protein
MNPNELNIRRDHCLHDIIVKTSLRSNVIPQFLMKQFKRTESLASLNAIVCLLRNDMTTESSFNAFSKKKSKLFSSLQSSS